MIIGRRYRDAMDDTRHVVPVDGSGGCRIFFDNKYVGNAPVPPNLFVDDPQVRSREQYTGFILDDVTVAQDDPELDDL